MTKFETFETLRDEESGCVAKITRRARHDHYEYSFSLQKEFDRDGITESTAFINKRHIDGARRLLDKLEVHLDSLEDTDRARSRARKAERGERAG